MNSGSTVPLWQALLLGFGAAAVGGLLVTWLRISHERTAELRTRMIQAADEFAGAAFRTIAPMRDAAAKIQDAEYLFDPDDGRPHADVAEARAEFGRRPELASDGAGVVFDALDRHRHVGVALRKDGEACPRVAVLRLSDRPAVDEEHAAVLGHYIDTGGNIFWGVQVFQHGGQEYFAASDIDHGLYTLPLHRNRLSHKGEGAGYARPPRNTSPLFTRPQQACGVPKLRSHRGITPICRLTPKTERLTVPTD
jgi:hypothetical protein